MRLENNAKLSESLESKVLDWLFWLRNLLALMMLASILIVVGLMDIPLQVWPTGLAPAGLVGFNVLVYWRLKSGGAGSSLEMTLHLLVDTAFFSYFLYWTGGSVNPFVSAYLVPVALAAVFGSLRHAVVIGLVSIALYSFLMVRYVPLPPLNGRFGGDFSLHVVGMWLNYILSAVITIVFVSSLARLAREREAALKQAEQDGLNNQHMVALGALAAGAAHELGTPLSNIAMLTDEISESVHNIKDETGQEISENAASIKAQLALCQSQISTLRDQANHAQQLESAPEAIKPLLGSILDRFKAMRSDMQIQVKTATELQGKIASDPALSQTVLNLLNNAADASQSRQNDRLIVSYGIKAGQLRLVIDDFGPGLNPEQQSLSGVLPFSTKANGLGIGLLLSESNLKRMGGALQLTNRAASQQMASGMRAEIRVPLSEAKP